MMRKRISIILLLILVLLLPLSTARAQTGGGFDLSWSTVEGGGVSVSPAGVGGEPQFVLAGVIGQADAGLLTGGSFALRGGFLLSDFVGYLYLPVVIRSGG